MEPAHGATGLGDWHDTTITGSLRWPWSRHSLSYILKSFSHKLEPERPHLPCQAICQLVQQGHLPPPTTRALPAGAMTQPISSTNLPSLETKHPCVCFLRSYSAGLFFHLLLPGAICDARGKKKRKCDPICLGYFHLSSATACHCPVVSVRVTCALQGEGRVEDSKVVQLLALNCFNESSPKPKLQLLGMQIVSLAHSPTKVTLKQ